MLSFKHVKIVQSINWKKVRGLVCLVTLCDDFIGKVSKEL